MSLQRDAGVDGFSDVADATGDDILKTSCFKVFVIFYSLGDNPALPDPVEQAPLYRGFAKRIDVVY